MWYSSQVCCIILSFLYSAAAVNMFRARGHFRPCSQRRDFPLERERPMEPFGLRDLTEPKADGPPEPTERAERGDDGIESVFVSEL